ncbi:ATP-dependent DNA helicase PIF1-like protein [Tanacetum coccineum]
MKENHPDQENHAIPNVVSSTPSGAITPTKLSHLAKQTSIVVRSDVWNNSATPRHNGRPRLPDLSACKPKDATSTPANAVSTSVGSMLSDNNNRAKRTRTPTQLSPLSKVNNNVQLCDTSRISLTPRHRGRLRMTDISTRTPFRDVTHVGSITFKSVISNGKDLDKTVGETSTKVNNRKSIRDNRASWFMKQTSVSFNIDYIDHGDPTFECSACSALLWYAESMRGATNASSDSYSLCCGRGKVLLKNEVDETSAPIVERIHNKLDYKLTTDIHDLLDEINPLVKEFRMAGERIRSSDDQKISLRLIRTRPRDGRQYNLPTTSEVAALIVGDFDSTEHKRDIILQCQDGDFKRISLLHPSYLALHYPLFFPCGEDNYHTNIFHECITDYNEKNKGMPVTMKQYFAYRIQERNNEFSMMLNGRRLFQHFIVDVYTMIESKRLTWNKKKDKDLRSETYSKLANLSQKSDSGVKLHGKKEMDIQEKDKNKSQIDKTEHENGKSMKEKSIVYTIEFQKSGLSHCHILLWLKPQDKLTTTGKIDHYVSAEILNKDEDPQLYQLVTDHIMHGLCCAKNPSCPCMVDYKFTNKFPKQFNELTVIEDSVMEYIKEEMIALLLRKTGQICTTGPDRVTATIDGEEVNEIKDYLNCTYLSSCEAAWCIYGFDIHYRNPSIEWIPFHLKDEQHVIFDATESIDYAVDKGPMEWDELKKVNDVLYSTYRDACYARGLLQADKEYIDGLLKASFWEWSLKDIQNMPYPDQEYTMAGYNRLIFDETSYNPEKLKEQHATLYGSLTTEKGIYSIVMNAVDNNKGGMLFVYGYGGTEKTYLYKTMSAPLRSKGEIVLNVASSGIATLLLEGGRTTHSRFAIPINVVEDSMCHIGADSDFAILICKAKLIIWDDTPMINMHCYEAFDRTLRDICRIDPFVVSDKVFGGKVVLFSGDFRQILPVITNGDIGNGKAGGANDSQSTVVFPDDMLIQETDDDVGAIIDDTYPDLVRNIWNPSFFQEKAILAPTHEMVDIINQRMLTMLIGDEKEYESSDSVCLADEDSNFDDSIYTTESSTV